MNDLEIDSYMVVCSKIVTGKGSVETELKQYESMRSQLLHDDNLRDYVPQSILHSPEGVDLYDYYQAKFKTYDERREMIRQEFQGLIEMAKEIERSGLLKELGKPLERFNSKSIKEDWKKASERAENDPSGSITSSRALIESTFKYILKDAKIHFESGDDISTLWKYVKKQLFPDFSSEPDEVKKMVGSVSMMVGNIKSIRNGFGDAHGRLDEDKTLTPTDARYIASLSASTCLFLLEFYEMHKTNVNQDIVIVSSTTTN